ncbi:winged helix-turn-helix domain-containing protein, partial [Leucobacter sp. M11]|uniref:winged helix-turn-helix domain-containing protein n=1 Tax=Leucobacter sp. M11 TaxID=2993565 RepID=UPI002D7FE3B2
NRGPWWDWSDTKLAVERLFAWGEVVSVGREGFQRRYALTEQALPAQSNAHETDRGASFRALIERAARAYGVGTAADLADYHRLKSRDALPAIRELSEAGVLVPVRVEGWSTPGGAPLPAWRHRDAVLPRTLAPDALVTPFDPLVWFRPRAERLFDFHYRIEIYTPKEQRRYGYYCLPLLVDGRLAGRIDLKADRAGGALLVQAAWREADAPDRTPEAAATLLREAAAWQGLDDIRVSGAGNLALPGL